MTLQNGSSLCWDASYSQDNSDHHFISQAYADLIKAFNWKSVVVLYENEESLVRLQDVLQLPKSYDGIKLKIQQLFTDTDDYRPQLKQIRMSGETKIVIDCSYDKIQEVLRQAADVDLVTDYHSYLITSLDVDRIDLANFTDINVNITGYRMIEPSSPAVAQYLKKWNYEAGDGKGESHPLYVSK